MEDEVSNAGDYMNINEMAAGHRTLDNRTERYAQDSTTASDGGFVGDRPDDLDDDHRVYDDVEKSVISFEGVSEEGFRANQVVTFRGDSTKTVDFVLAYDMKKDTGEKADMRKDYEENLADFGIELEKELSDKDCFVKLHCTFDALCRGAELMKLKKPIKKKALELQDKQGCFQCCHGNSTVKLQIYQPFRASHISEFQMENESSFFTDGEKNYIVYSLLEKAVFTSKDVTYTGLGSLLGKKAYKAAYPLHSPLPDQPTNYLGSMNEREMLIWRWARFKNLFSPQPLTKIKNYFGEHFCFYFAWLGLYTNFLFFASLAGLACFIYGLSTFLYLDIPTRDICDSNKSPGNFTICPKCDLNCNFYILSEGCNYARFTRIFDNEATVAGAIFICVWAICFLEFWKRKQLYLQQIWNVEDFEADENIRPQYYNQTDSWKKNPFSGKEEPVVSHVCKGARVCTSLSLILFLLATVLAAIFSVLVYRLAVSYALYQNSSAIIKSNAKLITTFTAAMLNVLCISILSFIYNFIAKVLTDLEAHKTRSSYEDSFIFKMVTFQFINNYGSIIYIAFFKGSFVDRPGYQILYVFNKYRQDECSESGCFSELTVQLMIIMVGKQVLNALLELFIPLALKCIRSRNNKNKTNYKPWEKDLDLQAHPPISMFSEYLEMIIQYGFVVMFIAAFPLAPLFAFINNVVEIRLDAHKMIKLYRRPPALKAQDIGAWQMCLNTISYLAVITNAFIIAWTSDFIPKQVYRWNTGKSLEGYVEWSLAKFNVSEFGPEQRPDLSLFPAASNVTECRYRTYSPPPSQIDNYFVPYYWQILCARWAFVIVFEHLCLLLMSITKLIPDASEEVKLRSQQGKALTDNINLFSLFDLVKQKRKNTPISSTLLQGFDGFENAVQ